MGRCLIATDLPQRHRCRVSNLVPRAGVISDCPKASSAGPAVLTLLFPPQGQPHSPAVAACHATFLPRRGTGGHVVERVGSDVTAFFLHLDRQFGDHAAQHFTESFGSVAPSIFGFAHGNNHEGSHDHEAVNLCQGLSNVCRA